MTSFRGELDGFRAVFEAIPGAHLLLTPDFRMVAASDERLRVTMTTREETIGRPLFEVFPDNPDDPLASGVANLTASLTEVLATGRPHRMAIQKYDIPRPQSEGGGFEERYWSPLNTPVLGPAGEVRFIIHTVEDVTERVRAEASAERLEAQVLELEEEGEAREIALRETEDRLQGLMDNAPDIIYRYSFVEPVGYEYVSPAVEKVLGYRPEDFYADPDLELEIVHPDDRHLIATLRDGHVDLTPFVLRWVHKDGHLVWTEPHLRYIHADDGRVVAVEGVVRDVTQRIRAEEERHAAEAQALRERTEILERIADGFFAVDGDWRITFANEQAHRMLQLEDAQGKDVWELFPEAVGTEFERQYRHAWETRTSVHFEAQYEPWGTWYEVHAHPSRDGLSVYFRDVTEQRAARERLGQKQKIEAIGQLAGGVAHDFNNLLTVIQSETERALGGVSERVARESLSEVRAAAERAAGLTRQLLAFSRQQVLHPQLISLNARVADTQRLLCRLLPENIDLEIDLDPDLASVKADPGQVDQLLVNLAVNARDAMPGGGSLRVATESVTVDESGAGPVTPRFTVPPKPGAYARILIRDTGTGMDDATLRRAFDPFFTTKGGESGTGLGLSTVYGIVKQSNGYIALDSHCGVGTIVEILFPAAVGHSREESEEPRTEPESVGRLAVLLVEDDPSVRRVVQRMLDAEGHDVVVATDTWNAEALASEQGPFDILVTDLVMPDRSGRELAQLVERRSPGIKVLYISGYTGDARIQAAAAQENADFLEKPFAAAELSARIARLTRPGGTQAPGYVRSERALPGDLGAPVDGSTLGL